MFFHLERAPTKLAGFCRGSWTKGKRTPLPQCLNRRRGSCFNLRLPRDMADFVFDPPLRLAGDVTARTLDDAAEFARNERSLSLRHAQRLPQPNSRQVAAGTNSPRARACTR